MSFCKAFRCGTCLIVGAAVLLAGVVLAGELEEIESIKVNGDLVGPNDISALGIAGDYLIVGSDEADRCQIVSPTDKGYVLMPANDVVLAADNAEIDIEGIACEGNRVYVIGSHSRVRPKLKDNKPYQSNRERLEQIKTPTTRDMLARFSLDQDGKASSMERTSLRSFINGNEILRLFATIPSKENGINIEGIAAKNGRLCIGFRGPVLRGNYVPILACGFDHVDSGKLLFVNLDGLGVRDITSCKAGFLILAGPVGDGPGSFKLFFWNGHDCLPGIDRPDTAGEVTKLCKVPCEEGAKAEGIVVTKEKHSHYEFLIAYDGLKNGGIKRFRLSKD